MGEDCKKISSYTIRPIGSLGNTFPNFRSVSGRTSLCAFMTRSDASLRKGQSNHRGTARDRVDESEEITVAVRADDLLEGDTADPEQHSIAIALRRQDDVDDARVTKNETLVRRGKKWFRYDAPDKAVVQAVAKDADVRTSSRRLPMPPTSPSIIPDLES